MRILAEAVAAVLIGQAAPVPEGAELKRAEALVRDVFREEYARKDAASRRALGQKLLTQGRESKDSPADRFTLFREARDVAADAGDVATAMAAAVETIKAFRVDAVPFRAAALEKLGKSAAGDDLPLLVEAHLALADEAAALEDYDASGAAVREAERLAQKGKSLQLVLRARSRTKEIDFLRAERTRVADARKKLEAGPGDPDASLVLGRHLCFMKGDWERGLPLLAAGSDAALKDLAAKELAKPVEAGAVIALADRWWDLSEREDAAAKAAAGGRAALWYASALPLSAGLSRVKIEKRLADLKQRGILPASGFGTVAEGLIGWGKLDEGTGEQAADAAGAAPGRLAQGTAWVQGKVGGALSFDGVDDVVSIPGTAAKDVSNTFTMALWALPKGVRKTTKESTSGASGIGGQRYAIYPVNAQFSHGPGHSNVGLSIGTNGISVFEHAVNYLPALLVHDMEITEWIHVAVVYTDRQPLLYVGGQLVRTGLKSGRSVHPSTSLGEEKQRYGHYAGLLDEIRLYNRALGEAEVRALASTR